MTFPQIPENYKIPNIFLKKFQKKIMEIPEISPPPRKNFCPLCQKSFKAKQSFLDHQMVHSGQKPLKWFFLKKKCKNSQNNKKKSDFQGCNKSFIQFSCLQKHKRTHSGEKPYNCPSCLRSFSQVFF